MNTKLKKILEIFLAAEMLIFSAFPSLSSFYENNAIARYIFFYFILFFLTTFVIFIIFTPPLGKQEIKQIFRVILFFYVPLMFITNATTNLFFMSSIPFTEEVIYIACSIFIIISALAFAICGIISIRSQGTKFRILYSFSEKLYKKIEKLAEKKIKTNNRG